MKIICQFVIALLPLIGPGGAATCSAQDAASPLVVGESFTLDSKALHETRRINVYLPATYAADQATRFPVIYMLDGGLAEDFLHVAGLVQVSCGNGNVSSFKKGHGPQTQSCCDFAHLAEGIPMNHLWVSVLDRAALTPQPIHPCGDFTACPANDTCFY